MEFKRPRVIGRGHAYGHALRFEFLVEFFCIFHAHAGRCSTSPLASAAEINTGAIAIHTGEIVIAPGCILKAELVHLESEAVGHFSTRRIACAFSKRTVIGAFIFSANSAEIWAPPERTKEPQALAFLTLGREVRPASRPSVSPAL